MVELTIAQKRVLSAIERCRTAALGGHIDTCRQCGYERQSYNSCRNRHCPRCQAWQQQLWITARCERLLPTSHFHVVFTLPRQLRGLAKYRPSQLYGALFSAASETLLALGKSRLKAQLGVTLVLHTWSRELSYHPHVHAIVTAGGLSLDGQHWQASDDRYLFPVRIMSQVYRGKLMAKLRALHQKGVFAGYQGFDDPEGYERLMRGLSCLDWVVYAEAPLGQVRHVVEYLGRYTHRVAISNSRLLDVTEEQVTFRTKDGSTCSLSPVEFLRRFIQHVLPPGFHKIRHYGLYSSQTAQSGGKLELARQALSLCSKSQVDAVTESLSPEARGSEQEQLEGRFSEVSHCPKCGGLLERRAVVSSLSRPP